MITVNQILMDNSSDSNDFDYEAFEKIIGQFKVNKERMSADEIENELFVTNIINDFLARDYISSDFTLNELTDSFKESVFKNKTSDLKSYLQYLKESVLPNCINTSSPRFIGHMTSALPVFTKAISKLIASMNQNTVKMETSKVMTLFERQSLAMLHRIIYNFGDTFYDYHIQNKNSTLGILCSGGTSANITSLWCAINNALGPDGDFKGKEMEGLPAALNYYGYTNAVVIVSSHVHYSFEKAADILGIGLNNIIKVPDIKDNCMDLQALNQIINKCKEDRKLVISIICVAGATESGNIDPIEDIAYIAKSHNIHLHVDAAWGGPLVFSDKHRSKLAGIELADTVTIDGHKQLYLPMGTGCLLFKNPALPEAIEKNAQYIIRKNTFDLGRRSLEGSRPSMSLYIHAGFSIIGSKGYGMLIDEGIRKTKYMAQCIIESSEFELLFEPQINILLYRHIPPQFVEKVRNETLTMGENKIINIHNEQLQKFQRQRGQNFISRTTIHTERYTKNTPIVALRAVIANPLTTEADIEAVLDEQIRISREIDSSNS
ncbi:MAG TPA: aminotransferase class V-fold PLP-dependent enzyme [Ruminiclostridium sp.]|nr:aminotransferase class V-fold PLP-dependent enzyme [Ruminiclostridium sp.]